jgi:hypothetical protein
MADQFPQLIPRHEPYQQPNDGLWDVWSYRGSTARSWGVTNRLLMQGHSLHEKIHVQRDTLFRIIDCWLDHGDLPAPYG